VRRSLLRTAKEKKGSDMNLATIMVKMTGLAILSIDSLMN
jgi:hypothetical protein